MKMLRRTAAIAVALAAFLIANVASADQWNERTILKFTEPVMIPGATLQPGTYIFKLGDSTAERNIVQVFKQGQEGERDVIATTQAVPIKRQDVSGQVILKFNPTEPGTPPALKAWFYPGTRYGHQFVYPADQAKRIAERTKTIVLSGDIEGSDLSKGTLYIYDASGKQGSWHPDTATAREWSQWTAAHPRNATMQAGNGESAENRESAAPAIQAQRSGMKLSPDELEDHSMKYVGKRVNVDAEVEKVLGPRLFTIDEPNWIDLEGETLVYVPSNHAAMVREGDRVTVSGTVKTFLRDDLKREWGWLDTTPALDAKLAKHPVLVADRVVGGNNDMALLIDVEHPAATTAVGTSGTVTSASKPITNLSALAAADQAAVGGNVAADNVRVDKTTDHGFWAQAGDTTIFVLPGTPGHPTMQRGDTVSLQGTVLQMPRSMRDRLSGGTHANTSVYVYATRLTKSSGQ